MSKYLDKSTLKALRADIRKHGMKARIKKKTSLGYSTLKRLGKEGCAEDRIVDIITSYYAKDEPTTTVIQVICEHFKITSEDISKNKAAKQLTAYLLYRKGGRSKSSIATELGYADHTGAKRAIDAVADMFITNAEMRKVILDLETKINV